MKSSFVFATVFLLILPCLYSCKKDISSGEFEAIKNPPNGMTVLGKKLQNPYSLTVMRQAFKNLKNKGLINFKSAEVSELQATDYYVRFLPTTDEQYDNLIHSDNLEVYDYPLDYEILIPGEYYHDSTISEEEYTWQYCAIKVTYDMPAGIQYQIIDELYIPQNDESLNLVCSTNPNFINSLENEAFQITENIQKNDLKSAINNSDKPISFYPSGRISVWDDEMGRQVPLEGVKVRARRWFTTYTAYTDSQGNYTALLILEIIREWLKI